MTNEPTRSGEFRLDINGLRAIAVSLVVLYHFKAPLITGGYVGVDCFFVISGFLMTKIIDEGLSARRFSLLRFYEARAVRIIPALAVLLAAILAFGYAALEPGTYRDLGLTAAAASAFLSDWKFALERGYFHPNSERNWLLHTWSLSVEWQFYLTYPLVYMLLSRIPSLWRARLALLAGTAALSFALNVLAVSIGGRMGTFAFFLMPLRAWEMMIGGMVFLVASRRDIPFGRPLEAVGLLLIAIAALAFDRFSPWPSFGALLPTLGAALVILANRRSDSVLRWRPMQAVGTWSYSIYLWHWPIAVGAVYFLLYDRPAAMAAGVAASVALGWLSFVLVEGPARRRVKQELGLRAAIASMAGLACVPLLASAAIVLGGGLPSRAKGDVAVILDAEKAAGAWSFPRRCQGMKRPGDDLRCFTREGEPAKLLVFGDSHAQMLYPLLSGPDWPAVEFLSTVGCPPIPDLERREGGFNCVPIHQEAVQQMLESPITDIIYASIWVPYLDIAPDAGVGTCLMREGRCEALRDRAQVDAALEGLRAEIRELTAAGKRVTVVQPFPVPHRDIAFEVRDAAFRGAGAVPPLSLAQRPEAEAIIRDFLASLRDDGLSLIDPRDAMCSDGVCPVTDAQGRTLYIDGNHLRPEAVRRLAGLFAPLLRSVTSPRGEEAQAAESGANLR